MCEAELYLIVDASGDYATGKTVKAAIESYEADIQPIAESGGYRVVALKVCVPLPEPVELVGEAPAIGGAALSVA